MPVVTGTTLDRTFTTAVLVKNAGAADAECTFTYRGPERIGKPLVSK